MTDLKEKELEASLEKLKRLLESVSGSGDRPFPKAETSASSADHILGYLSQVMMWAAADPEGVGKNLQVVELSRMVKEQLDPVNKTVNELRLGAWDSNLVN
ncbi:uncharacterized protein LOC141683166 [Apium graveolens]|uniref:uncharacterized protein LOC141683166 n=1 Tax=Apium graveolens TaxID=4045 RepID=UPI003D7BFEE1